MTEWESVSEWLHGHPSRMIIIKPAGHRGKDGEWAPYKGRSTLTLITRLPDGRKVMWSAEILDEAMIEPVAGEMLIHDAKMAFRKLLENKETP